MDEPVEPLPHASRLRILKLELAVRKRRGDADCFLGLQIAGGFDDVSQAGNPGELQLNQAVGPAAHGGELTVRWTVRIGEVVVERINRVLRRLDQR